VLCAAVASAVGPATLLLQLLHCQLDVVPSNCSEWTMLESRVLYALVPQCTTYAATAARERG
jgi:hypothetical protein